MGKKKSGGYKNPLPDVLPCICGSGRVSRENWRDMNKILECELCGRKVWKDTWREAIAAWNNGETNASKN